MIHTTFRRKETAKSSGRFDDDDTHNINKKEQDSPLFASKFRRQKQFVVSMYYLRRNIMIRAKCEEVEREIDRVGLVRTDVFEERSLTLPPGLPFCKKR
jgi:hypothetical protein